MKQPLRRTVLDLHGDLDLAQRLIKLGARAQVVTSETCLSHDMISRLHREIHGCSPPKGMLPFSVDWYMTTRPNLHSSLFYSIYLKFELAGVGKPIEWLMQAFEIYLESELVAADSKEAIISFTRAWMLQKFFASNQVEMIACKSCGLSFINHAYEPNQRFRCMLCNPAPRSRGPGNLFAPAPAQSTHMTSVGHTPSSYGEAVGSWAHTDLLGEALA